MNPAAILTLISDLVMQVDSLAQQLAEAQKQLAEAQKQAQVKTPPAGGKEER